MYISYFNLPFCIMVMLMSQAQCPMALMLLRNKNPYSPIAWIPCHLSLLGVTVNVISTQPGIAHHSLLCVNVGVIGHYSLLA